MTAMCAQNIIIGAQLTTDANSNGFLATIHMERSDNIAKIGLTICFFFEKTNSPHHGVHRLANPR
jgi:hypothetical protein